MTKRQDGRSKLTTKLRKGGLALAALGMTGALGMALTGCDTVAKISFSERNFRSIYSSGFTPVPADGNTDDVIASCMGVDATGASSTTAGKMKLRFVLTDNDNNPIRAGETVDNQSVELERSNLEFSDSALTEVSLSKACVEDTECSGDNYTCDTAPGLTTTDSGLDVCHRAEADGLEVDSSIDFVADTNFHQVYGILVQNSGSLRGYNPPGSGNLAWDSDGDGITDVRRDPGLNTSIGTDPGGARKNAVSALRKPWENTAKVAKNEGGRKTYFGLWTFAGTTVNTVGDDNNEIDWVRDPADVDARITKYFNGDPTENRANVYEAIQRVINQKYSTNNLAGYVGDGGQADKIEKVLTVFVDGPDALRTADDEIKNVVATAREHNVRVFIVHLDARVETPLKIREDPRYHENQETTCTDDSECKNYETCRRPRGYKDNVGEETDFGESDTYCMIDRDIPNCASDDDDCISSYCPDEGAPDYADCVDENTAGSGRIGPINDYALLACATGGGYMYVPSPEALTHHIEWTPYALEGLWETTIHSAETMRGNVPAGEPLLIHGNMSVSVSGTEMAYPFNQLGQPPSGAGSTSEDFDTRSAIFTRTE